MKTYQVTIAKKVFNQFMNQYESGENVDWQTFKTLREAKSYCLKALKKTDMYSAWIHLYDENHGGDFLCQWVKYAHKKDWSIYNQY